MNYEFSGELSEECTQIYLSLQRAEKCACHVTQQGLGRQMTGRWNHQTAWQFQAVEICSLIGLPSVHFPLSTKFLILNS